MAVLSTSDVQILLDQPAGTGMVVSCYADMSVAQGFEPHWVGHFKREASRIRQALADDELARDEFERNLTVVRSAFDTEDARRARGLAVFSSVARGFFRSHALDVAVEHRLVLDEELYLVPLVEALDRQRECLVVLTNTHRGRVYAATPGSARVLKEVEEVVPKHHRASGQRRGKEPGLGIERHRQDAILHFHKKLAHELETVWSGATFRGIILLGHDEGLAQFREHLPSQLASHVMHQTRYAWTGKQPQIHEVVAASIAEATAKEASDLMAELHGRLVENHRVAAGPQEVLDALRNGQVLSLVLGPDPGLVASRCTGCGSVFAAEQAICSYCRAACHKTNLWQQILTTALRHNVPVHFVKPDAAFSKRGAVAAMLSRDG